ncbi:hypothetical protein FQZ97_855280 [compost metagenome]
MARALWHRAGGGPAGRRHANADRGAGPGHAGVRAGPLGPRGRAFPFLVPVPADGAEWRLPYGRPLQPVRVLRGAAGRVLRPVAARLRYDARQRRPAVHRGEPGGVVPAADQHCADLWRHGHAESGGPGAARGQPGRRRPHAVRGGRSHPGRGLPGEGGRLALELLARQGLWLGRRARRRHVLHHDQGGHLRAAAHRFAAAADGRARGVQPGLDVRGRPGHAAVRRPWPAGHAAAGENGGLLRHCVGRHAADRPGHARRNADRPGAVLPDQFGADHGRVLPVGRADRAYPQFRRQRAGGDARRFRPRRPGLGQPFRRRGGGGHPRCHGLPGPGVHLLRAAGDGAAAAVGLRREALAAVGRRVGGQ